jgi:hypothetical protein
VEIAVLSPGGHDVTTTRTNYISYDRTGLFRDDDDDDDSDEKQNI